MFIYYHFNIVVKLTLDRINVTFWDLGNLFDISSSAIASELEFTPGRGWDNTVKE